MRFIIRGTKKYFIKPGCSYFYSRFRLEFYELYHGWVKLIDFRHEESDPFSPVFRPFVIFVASANLKHCCKDMSGLKTAAFALLHMGLFPPRYKKKSLVISRG